MNANGNATALEPLRTAPIQRPPLEFSPEQRQMIRNTFASGASEPEFAVLMEVARARNLNPILGQIHFVKRWTQARGEVWSTQVAIDGLRAIAERTGKYDGQDEPEFEYDKDSKIPKLARVRIHRKDWTRPAVGVAHFSEYAQRKKDGGLTMMWADKPHIMLAKCAEALAFRKAFPEDTSGLYAPEEMGHDAESRHTLTASNVDASEESDDEKIARWVKEFAAAHNKDALAALAKELKKEELPAAVRTSLGEAYKARKAQFEALADREPGSDG